ncbi:MAG TPA: glycosyltransferase family 2 protein [Fimbriimonadaceae bacterium]|nr:glycosyltransferase family 2 protein [Fimbriimonadaceae bacterium]
MSYRPGITGFVVFGDGEDRLRRCLASLAPAVDELIAIDTGATDGSREIAESFRARIYDLVWPDSFQEAYNFAIEKVDTQWTLWLDSDEWLQEDAREVLVAATARPGALGYNLIRRDFYREGLYTEMHQLRLWRTHPLLRLQGHIHAQFPERAIRLAAAGRKVLPLELSLYHDGFLGGMSPEKSARNLPYIRRELAERPGQLYYEICLAETLMNLGDPEGVTTMQNLAAHWSTFKEDQPPEKLISVAFAAALDSFEAAMLGEARVDAIIRQSWRWFSNVPIVLWAVAQAERRRGNLFGAYHALLELEEVAEKGYDRTFSFDPHLIGLGLYSALSEVAFALGKGQKAADCGRKLREIAGSSPAQHT